MDTKKLRQKILDLAIHGRLVPQCPDDEPAALLLQRINPDATIHYDAKLPKGWVVVEMGNVANYINGRAFKPEEWETKGLPIVRIQNLNDNKAAYNYSTQTFEPKYLINNGDLLFAWAASLGTYIWNGGDAWLNQHIFKVEPYPFVDKTFMYYALQSMIADFYNQSHGSGMVHITRAKFVKLPFYLPPLEEQRRIVKEIEHWFKWIEQIEQGKAHLQDAVKAAKAKILDLAIHGKLVPQCHDDEHAEILLKRINPDAIVHHEAEVPKGWCNTILGELFFHNTGKALNSSNREGEVRKYLTTSNVYWDRFELDAVKEMPFKQKELEKCTVTKGDLLVCEGGDIGRSAIWNYDYDICIQNHIHRLRPKTELCVRFYFYVLMYYKINYMIGGKGIGLLGLSSNELHKIQLPLPPLQEQRRIVARIQQLFAQLDTITESL